MTEQIKVKQDGAVLEIVFARPDKKNALSNAMYRAATEALNTAQKNPAIRVVLFAAEGDAFTAGENAIDHSPLVRDRRTAVAAIGKQRIENVPFRVC